jgi:cell division protein FtsA
MVFSGLAGAQAVLSETEKELGVVLVDVGAGTTSLTAYVEGAIAHSAVIPIGARNITNDLAIGMRISLNHAETVKLFLSKTQNQLIITPAAKPADVTRLRKDFDTIDLNKLGIAEETTAASRKALVDGIIRPRLNELFGLIATELQTAGISKSIPAGLVLTGGGAETVAILEVAKRYLSLPARVGIPKGLTGLVDELHSPAFATGSGLILYAQKYGEPGNQPAKGVGNLPKLPGLNLRPYYDQVLQFIKNLLP